MVYNRWLYHPRSGCSSKHSWAAILQAAISFSCALVASRLHCLASTFTADLRQKLARPLPYNTSTCLGLHSCADLLKLHMLSCAEWLCKPCGSQAPASRLIGGTAMCPAYPSWCCSHEQCNVCSQMYIFCSDLKCKSSFESKCDHLHNICSSLLAHSGAEIKISRPVEDKNPVVIARLGRDPSKRTVAFYGHYDIQPAMEREWTTNPFEMNAIDGYYYGRGTSDNKVV